MTTVLASLCNVKRSGIRFPLVVGDLSRRRFGLVDGSAWITAADTGVTGLLATDEAVYLALQRAGGGTGRLVVLAPDLSLRAVVADERFRDLHAIRRLGDEIWIVSTGNARLFSIDGGTFAVRERWAHEQADGRLHLNDVCLHEGRVLALSHVHPGHAGEGRSGAVWDLESREVVIGGLKHPHSLIEAGGRLHCLSSASGQLVSRDPSTGKITRARLGGYLRGLAPAGDGFVVGQSALRFYSRKRGPAVDPVDLDSVVGNPTFMSFLGEVEGRRLGRRHNLTHLGLEIYDVVTAALDYEAVVAHQSAQLRAQTLYQRIAELEMLLDGVDGVAAGEADLETDDETEGGEDVSAVADEADTI